MMTNHDYDRNSCYCTDFAIGYLGIINESLVYSYSDKIEFLPATPKSFENGEICGIRTRNRCVIDSLRWDFKNSVIIATITSEINQTLTISCGISDDVKEITFEADTPRTVEFTF